jgi:hypothetical protein
MVTVTLGIGSAKRGNSASGTEKRRKRNHIVERGSLGDVVAEITKGLGPSSI